MRQNRPIKSSVKGVRLIQREPIDATSWAYMKLLRENNRTKRIYDVNPYAEVYQFRENMYGILTESADGMGDVWSYLIIGPEKAMLIDTGFGIGSLKDLVNSITGDIPLIVANTHCHFDHAYGNCQFDRCYCHEHEADAMNLKQDPHIWDYLFDENGKGIWMDFDREDIIPYKVYKVVGVPDGYVFNLGGDYEIELVWIPGHSAGHAMFLDKKCRLLFAGDGIISMRIGISRASPFNTVCAYRKEMVKLSKRMDEFDHIFSGHFIGNLETSVIPSLIETCDAIIADPADYDDIEERPGRQTLLKFVKGLGTIGYSRQNAGADDTGPKYPITGDRAIKANNIGITSAIKSKKIKVNEPIEERCWAFMKELREHHVTKTLYDLNPYAEVYRLRDNLFGILTEHLGGGGDVWSFLIVGPEKAMLIDTGFGVGDLQGLANELSGNKPLLVANTHTHRDHASGNCQFDRVYCHENSVPQLEQMRNPHLWDQLFDDNGKPIWTNFDKDDIVPFKEYKIVGCPDGFLFNLGGDYDVELVFTAGHTSGHCMFLDKKSRLLFAGDDVISMRISIGGPLQDDPFGEFATVHKYRDQMAKLACRLDEFDYVFPAHFIYDLESYVILDLVETANAIAANPLDYDYAEVIQTGSGTITRYHKFVKGLGTLAYTENAVGVRK